MTHGRPYRGSRRTLVAAASAALLVALTGCSTDSALPSAATTQAAIIPDPSFENGIYAIDCDPVAHARVSQVEVLSNNVYQVGSWNHVNGVGSMENVALPVGEYRITAENYLPVAACGGEKALSVVLAKKTWDWDKQHANGMEASFSTSGATFGTITDISLELRVDSDRTSIPTADELAAAYGDLLTPEQLLQLDGQQINLELTLFGSGATADQPFMNASTIISIDPVEFADGWVRVQVPREELTFYTEENYVRTEVGADAHGELLVQGLRINPETANGATVRRIVTESGGDFDPQARPELFKEMGLTFSIIEVGRETMGA